MKNRSRIALLVIALFMVGTGSITAYQSLSKTVAIIDDGKVSQYETWDVSVEEVLKNQEIIIGPRDEVTPGLDEEIENGTKIIIERWKPTVTITLDGEEMTFETDVETVADVLEIKRIELGEKDYHSVALEEKITDGMTIEIKTYEVTSHVTQEPIGFETQIVETAELPSGEQRVATEGKNGVKEVTRQIVRLGGEIVEETVVESTVITPPQTKIIEQGKKNIIIDEYTGKVYEYTAGYTMEATAYTDIPGDRWYGITASGAPTFVGMVAVDRDVIPLGTILYVEGYGIAIAGDVGGAINGYDIDLFMATREEVYNHGRVDREVYILKDQSYDVDGIIAARQHY